VTPLLPEYDAMTSRIIAALIAMAIASSPLTDPALAQTPEATALDLRLREAIKRHKVPGVVALVTGRQGVIYQGAHGVADVATGRPLTADALFRIASMTKPVTSVAAMQLVEQGKIALDDPVERFLPALAKPPVFQTFDARTGQYQLRPSTKPITVRHLLTHTSGLGYVFTSPTLRDFKPRAGESYPVGPLLFEPGEQWMYGTSTDMIGRLVETVSGRKLNDYFRRHIFAPLRMTDTSYNVSADKARRLVSAHHRAGARLDGNIVALATQPARTVRRPSGGGGLVSTASDYGRFMQMLLNGGELDGRRVLRAETVALMGQNHIGAVSVPALKSTVPRSRDFSFIADGRDKWGLGFLITTDQVQGKRSPGSLSWAGISNTYFWIDPKRGIAGVVLMQFLPFADKNALALYDTFQRAIYRLADSP
jgi:CubicO group peptidase (beta-lactamase class C family)